jgi:hypothetical protein
VVYVIGSFAGIKLLKEKAFNERKNPCPPNFSK